MDAVTIPYSIKMMAQLVRRFLNNDFPNDAFSISINEIYLHIWQSVSDKIVKLAYVNAQVEGVLAVAEAFLVTYNLTVTQQDSGTGYWYVTLPQPPLSLPLGYSINDAYFVDPKFGKSQSIWLIKAKRVAYRNDLPEPPGVRGWVEGNTFWMTAYNNVPLLNANLRVQMPTGRSTDLDAPFNMPDDIVMQIFQEVVTKLSERFKMPRDNVKDNEPAGNNALKS